MVRMRPNLIGSDVAVSGTHWIPVAVAISILQMGGNAFDAAVAAAFAFYLAEPGFNGLGGEAVILANRSGSGAVEAIYGLGAAPNGSSPEKYRDRGFEAVPSRGLLAATTPGAFDAWMLLLRDYGTFSLETCLAPAVRYAVSGVSKPPSETVECYCDGLRKHLASEVALPRSRESIR